MLTHKTALITGGARGLGAAHARTYLAHGANVVIGDVLDDEGDALADQLGDRCRFVHLDVTDESAWAAAVATATTTFGSLDILVNNAAICPVVPLLETAPEDFRRVLDVNAVGPFLGIRAVAPVLPEGGVIINIASIDGIRGVPNLVAYCASKYALRGITRTAALELAPRRIRVNAIHPGGIDTAMFADSGSALLERAGIPGATGEMLAKMLQDVVPAGRISDPHEIAEVSAFLASERGAYCNGAEIVLDGGLTAGSSGA